MQVAQELGPGKKVVTIIPDRGREVFVGVVGAESRTYRMTNEIGLLGRVAVLAALMTTLCAATGKPVGPCFQVHGRLLYWNGAPSTRIWIIGTHRMLGIPSEDQELPANVKALLKGDFDDEVYGNFLVCPLDRFKPGEMQMVFVKSANHLAYRHRP